VVQQRQKQNSTEVETRLMQPNEAFWQFAAEVQPSDLKSSCFDEELNIMKNNEPVGSLKISITSGESVTIGGKDTPTFNVCAHTRGLKKSFELSQTVSSQITEDLNLISERKEECTEFMTKVIETKYIENHGYRMSHEVKHNKDDDDSWQKELVDSITQMSFLCDTPKALMSDGTALLLQRLLPKIGVYQIDLPYLDIDAKLVSLSSISSLGFKTQTFDNEDVDLVGLQRTHNLRYGPHVYNIWLFEDGHIAMRESSTGIVQVEVERKPELIKDEEDLEPVINLPRLNWNDDMQLKSIYRQRATELSVSHATYLEDNANMMKLLRDFYTSTLAQKPENIYSYAKEYFLSFCDQ